MNNAPNNLTEVRPPMREPWFNCNRCNCRRIWRNIRLSDSSTGDTGKQYCRECYHTVCDERRAADRVQWVKRNEESRKRDRKVTAIIKLCEQVYQPDATDEKTRTLNLSLKAIHDAIGGARAVDVFCMFGSAAVDSLVADAKAHYERGDIAAMHRSYRECADFDKALLAVTEY